VRAQCNEKLAQKLNLDDPCEVDWAVTMLFYSALHYISAYQSSMGRAAINHQHRDELIENNASLRPIYPDYRFLKDRSEQARYQIAGFHRDRLKQFHVRFDKVKKLALSLLK
jgi:uncharacterized protein YktB (UPF0637 family)